MFKRLFIRKQDHKGLIEQAFSVEMGPLERESLFLLLKKESDHLRFIGKFNSTIYIESIIAQTHLQSENFAAHFEHGMKKVSLESILFLEGYDSLKELIKFCTLFKKNEPAYTLFTNSIINPILGIVGVYSKLVTPDGTLPIGHTRFGKVAQMADFPLSTTTDNFTLIHDNRKNFFFYINHPEIPEQFGNVSLWTYGHWALFHPFTPMNSVFGFNTIKKGLFQSQGDLKVIRKKNEIILKCAYGTRKILAFKSSIQIIDFGGGESEFVILEAMKDDVSLVGKVESEPFLVPSILLPMRRIRLTGRIRSITFHV